MSVVVIVDGDGDGDGDGDDQSTLQGTDDRGTVLASRLRPPGSDELVAVAVAVHVNVNVNDHVSRKRFR